MTTALLLTGYAVALLLAAAWLRRAPWVQRAPKLGIAAWCLVSFGTVVAVLLVGIVLMISSVPWTANVAMMFRACTVAVREQYQFPAGELAALLGGFLVIAVAARLVYCLGATHIAGARQRRRQRRVLGLVGRRDPALDAVIVEHDVAAAYCVPGRGRNVVLTSAALANLNHDQIRAVLAHEQAHLRGRHHLLVTAASAIQRAYPFIAILRHAADETARLVEIVADDAATRRYPGRTVAGALVALAEASTPAASLAAGGPAALMRVERLLAPPAPLGGLRTVAGSVAMGLLIMLPLAVAVAPAVMVIATTYCPYDLAMHPTVP